MQDARLHSIAHTVDHACLEETAEWIARAAIFRCGFFDRIGLRQSRVQPRSQTVEEPVENATRLESKFFAEMDVSLFFRNKDSERHQPQPAPDAFVRS